MAAAIVGRPEVIFLDEPTTGFDPAARREAWRLVADLTAGGAPVILTTHFLDEAQHLAHRVAVITNGRIVAEGDPSTLGGRDMAEARIRFRTPTDIGPLPVTGARDENGWTFVSAVRPTETLHVLTTWALAHGMELEGLEVTRPSLEDTYLALAGDGA
jgi:ABC-2 type transport system ATP-binding protein